MFYPSVTESSKSSALLCVSSHIKNEVEYLYSTAALSPSHTSCLSPSGFERSQCFRCPGATSPATSTPHGGCPPGTGLSVGERKQDHDTTCTVHTEG